MVYPAHLLSTRRVREKRSSIQLRHPLSEVDKEHSTQANYLFYLATAPEFFAPIVQQLARLASNQEDGTLAAGGHRKALRTRSGIRAGFEPQLQCGVAGKADLSHRSLPGQGNRPEHPGFAFRQRNFRAHLEPALHRSRTDLQCGNRGRGKARRLLRQSRRPARHGAQPHHAAHQPDRDGAAGFISAPTRSATNKARFCTRSSR